MTAQEEAVGQTTRVPRISLPTWSPERFQAARQARGWTLGELGATADVGYSAVAAYAQGRAAPPPPVLVRLAQALGVDTTELAPLSQRPTLHELRWHAGLDIATLAERLRLTRDYVAQMARGEVRIRDLEAWADALGVTPQAAAQAWENSHALLNRRS